MSETDHIQGEGAVVASTARPLTGADVRVALASAGVRSGELIIVHTSLSRLGWIVGGAQTVVHALVEVVGPTGTIVMPAHTGVSDPARWENPPVPEDWWPIIREQWPAFDASLTPTRAMGAVTECFRRLPDVLHSGHPAVPVVARGPLAATITHAHPLEQSLGDESPMGRLYDLDARIVLLGVDHANNTSLHLCEHRADWPTKTSRADGAPLFVDGQRRWVEYVDLDHRSDDFATLGTAFVASGGAEQQAALGNGAIRTCSMREIVDFGTVWIAASRTP